MRLSFALGLIALSLAAKGQGNGKYFLYAGTSTNRGTSKGIYVYRYDSTNGKTEDLGLAAESPNPSFLAVHPNRRFLYAVNEISNYTGAGVPAGGRAGSIATFSIDPQTGKLTQL